MHARVCTHVHTSPPHSPNPSAPQDRGFSLLSGVALLATQGSLSRDRPWPSPAPCKHLLRQALQPSGGQVPPAPEDWGLGGEGVSKNPNRCSLRVPSHPQHGVHPNLPPWDVGTRCQPASPTMPGCRAPAASTLSGWPGLGEQSRARGSLRASARRQAALARACPPAQTLTLQKIPMVLKPSLRPRLAPPHPGGEAAVLNLYSFIVPRDSPRPCIISL